MAAPESSRQRLLQAGKHLFATRGYENTSTIMIAREAGTSESQLIKHFGSKDGLLESIFQEGWSKMNLQMAAVRTIDDPLQKLRALIQLPMDLMESDPELKELMLLESRRIRKQGSTVLITQSFMDFMDTADDVLKQMHERGQLRANLRPAAVRSALIGMAEGIMRDQLLARRMGRGEIHDRAEVQQLIEVVLPSMLAPQAQSGQISAANSGKTKAAR